MATAMSFESALCQCRHIVRSSTTPFTATRAFTSSASRQRSKQLPVFKESPLPELNSLLAEIRSKIFIPGYLKKAQRNLVFKPKHRSMLESEPFIVDIGEEQVQLEPLEPLKDIPSTWGSLRDAMKMFGDSPEQWQNLLALLEGFYTSERRFTLQRWEEIARIVGDAGMAQILVEAARRVNATGFELKNSRLVRLTMWACIKKAMMDDFSEDASVKAASLSTQICHLLEREEHCGQLRPEKARAVVIQYGDPRLQPDIIGAHLFLQANYMVQHRGGVDEEGQVEQTTHRLLANFQNEVEAIGVKNPQKWPAAEADYQLWRWVPTLRGLQLAQQMLGSQIRDADQVASHIDRLTQKTKQWRDAVQTNSTPEQVQEFRKGAVLYDMVF